MFGCGAQTLLSEIGFIYIFFLRLFLKNYTILLFLLKKRNFIFEKYEYFYKGYIFSYILLEDIDPLIFKN